MVPTRLIVNADDLGLHPNIDEGIFEAHARGIVTSASLLTTGDTAAAAVARANEQNLALGVHLCLTGGLPAVLAGEVERLAPGGRFRTRWAELLPVIALESSVLGEIERELAAQLERAEALGARIDHLDTHQHLHLLPPIHAIVTALAEARGLPVRWPGEKPRQGWLNAIGPALKSTVLLGLAMVQSPPRRSLARAIGLFEAGALDEAALLRLIDGLGEGAWEIGCHPGKGSFQVEEDPRWRYRWQAELEALTSLKVQALIAQRGVVLTTYGQLAARAAT